MTELAASPFNLFILFVWAVLLVLFVTACVSYRRILLLFGEESLRRSVHVEGAKRVVEKSARVTDYSRKQTVLERLRIPNMLHTVVVQFIPLFPLLGIFGTVLGLYGALSGMGEALADPAALTALFPELRFALTSTLTGLISAISLKFLDAVIAAPMIEDIDSRLDAFDAAIEQYTLKHYAGGKKDAQPQRAAEEGTCAEDP